MNISLEQARQWVDKPLYTEDIIYNELEVDKIIAVIHIADEEESEHCTVKKLAAQLKGGSEIETCQNIWEFMRSNIKYVADKLGYERVRKANRVIQDGEADCKSFTVTTNSLLRANGIKSLYHM
ncbi:MAG: hypothetical protein RLZZ628_2886 [Bacteroidota bacterium]|jgi:transglutaminase-like putative cysteine protease